MGTFAEDPWARKFPPRPAIPTGPGGIPVGSPTLPEAAGVGNFLGPRSVSTTTPTAPGGGMTLEALMARQKELAGQQTPMTSMQSPMQGIAYALEKGLAGFQEGRASKEVATGQQAVANALTTMGEHGELTPEGKAALAQYDPNTFLALWKSQQKQFGPVITGDEAKTLGLDPNKQYQLNLGTGQYDPIGGGGQTIQVGGEGSDVAFNKEFSKTDADTWNAYLKAGPMASQVIGSMDMLDQLSAVAPQGGLTGALAEAFPGFNSAAAAWQATVNDILPKLKVEGSGAQSDADLDNIRKSMPRLGNNQAANQLISAFVRRKAEQNLKRSQLVAGWANGPRDQASQVKVREQLMAIDSEDLMTPELRRLVQQLNKGENKPADPDAAPDEAGSGPSHEGGGGPDAGTGGGAEKTPEQKLKDKFGI